jgi:hypothetical protein
MLQLFFHAWERRLASVTKDRVVRPFDWGLDWMPPARHSPEGEGGSNGSVPDGAPQDRLRDWISHVMADTDAFYTVAPTTEYTLTSTDDGARLTFPSAYVTPHLENNVVSCRYFPARVRNGAAVLVLPQWNSDAGGHVGLSRLLAMNGMSALRLSLPYHDQRMPPELSRADYIVSSNVARTVQVCRQAVLDARRAIHWLAGQGYTRIGIVGSSLGSCLALLTTAHEPLIRAQALNHISPYFADVVWRGLSTRHVREGLDGHIDLDLLRTLWGPISPQLFLDRVRDRRTLLVYARYDLTFPVDLSEDLVRAFREHGIPHDVAALRCGHYSIGKSPFKYVDGWILTRFLRKALSGPG